jgi:ADP-ribosyl-[dinitrogen reductase] hydrolase
MRPGERYRWFKRRLFVVRPDSPFQRSPNYFYVCLLGTAVGDSIGLPREGLSRRRARRIFGGPPLEHALFGRWGAVSDDTEHACMTAQALIASAGDPKLFARELARRLRWWLLTIPAGIGLGTLRAILKLWLGFPPDRSGVRSAGNGPAMRAAILGVFARGDLMKLSALVQASTRITHTDPRAEQGAMVVALAAAYSLQQSGSFAASDFLRFTRPYVSDNQLWSHLSSACQYAAEGKSAEEFADSLGQSRGVSGFINMTVPVAIFCWLRHRDDFRAAVEAAVCLGGDTDTVGAIVGGLSAVTSASVPPDAWSAGILTFIDLHRPTLLAVLADSLRSYGRWTLELGEQLAAVQRTGEPQRPAQRAWPVVFARNAIFAAVVLLHGFRRLLPPY